MDSDTPAKVAIDGVGRWHLLDPDDLKDDPVCGYPGDVAIVEHPDPAGQYWCPQCEVRQHEGPGVVVVSRGDGGSGLL